MSFRQDVGRFLDRVMRDKIAPVGVGHYIDVQRLVEAWGEGDTPRERQALLDAVCALLATDERQAQEIRDLAKQHFQQPAEDRSAGRRRDADEWIVAPPGTPESSSPVSRALAALANLPAWVHGCLLVGLVAALAAGFVLLSSPGPLPVAEPAEEELEQVPEARSDDWEKVLIEAEERRLDKMLPPQPRDLSDSDGLAIALGAAVTSLGVAWIVLPWHLRRRRRREADVSRKQARTLRSEMSREAAKRNVSRRLVYHVPPVAPLSDAAAADSATIVGRLFGRVESRRIDVDRTVAATASSGGRVIAVLEKQRIARSLIVLVNVEAGDHPFLGDVEWLLGRWRSLGVRFRRYDFEFQPTWLTDPKTGLVTSGAASTASPSARRD